MLLLKLNNGSKYLLKTETITRITELKEENVLKTIIEQALKEGVKIIKLNYPACVEILDHIIKCMFAKSWIHYLANNRQHPVPKDNNRWENLPLDSLYHSFEYYGLCSRRTTLSTEKMIDSLSQPYNGLQYLKMRIPHLVPVKWSDHKHRFTLYITGRAALMALIKVPLKLPHVDILVHFPEKYPLQELNEYGIRFLVVNIMKCFGHHVIVSPLGQPLRITIGDSIFSQFRSCGQHTRVFAMNTISCICESKEQKTIVNFHLHNSDSLESYIGLEQIAVNNRAYSSHFFKEIIYDKRETISRKTLMRFPNIVKEYYEIGFDFKLQ